ncbi:MAG: pro-sigmaK processing inhibitor BofA family protein, partial [Alicyclobacillus sp.]|nr:pro-sigmaK processing inhibitor BofA family protein [Alicyclobacillus sp.]
VLGCLFIYAVNWVGQQFHFHLPLNPVTALTAGFLGIPGLVALVALHLWLYT